jgi:hypothetical protein
MPLLTNYLTEREFVDELRAKIGAGSLRTIRSWRERRQGPPFTRLGKAILYPADLVETWLRSRIEEPVRSRRAA